MSSILHVDLQGFAVDGAYVWPTAVYSHSTCNLVVWKSATEQEKDWEEIKNRIAMIMDRLADLLHAFQEFGPLIALVELEEHSSQWSRLIGDQDWHRGRFVIQGVKTYSGDSLDIAKKRWLGPLLTTQYSPRKVSNEDFIESFDATLKNVQPPKGAEKHLFTRYATILRSAIESDRTNDLAANWQDELISDINNLLGRSILEVSDFGK